MSSRVRTAFRTRTGADAHHYTAAFATYVSASHNGSEDMDTPLYACGWDYLRDALLLILADHFLDAEAPLAVLVAPSICMALVSLMASSNGNTGMAV